MATRRGILLLRGRLPRKLQQKQYYRIRCKPQQSRHPRKSEEARFPSPSDDVDIGFLHHTPEYTTITESGLQRLNSIDP